MADVIVQLGCTNIALTLSHDLEKNIVMEAKIQSCGCGHCQMERAADRTVYVRLSFSFVLLLSGLIMMWTDVSWFGMQTIRLCWFVLAWLPVAVPVMKEACEAACKKDWFNEFMLMSVASVGAFCIGEYPEAVAVMLFYSVGEFFQDKAVDKARRHIKSLLDMRPQTVAVRRGGTVCSVRPEEVSVGEEIEVKVGERVALDGVLTGERATFNTAALTGESVPRVLTAGDEILAGMIPTEQSVRLRTVRAYADSALSRILDMVQNAASRKAPTEQFIRKFSRLYTPSVTGMAVLLVLLPYVYSLAVPSFTFDIHTYLYRALVFLVISCPCALVISIPLSYFGGIGAASRRGVLLKGSNYLDALTRVNAVVFDKTGTLTRGVFRVQEVCPSGCMADELVVMAAAAESGSSHPIGKAVMTCAAGRGVSLPAVWQVRERAGLGLMADTELGEILVGKSALLRQSGVECPEELSRIPETLVTVACNGRYVGYLLLADEPKEDAARAVERLRQAGIRRFSILSGDKTALVEKLALRLGITEAYGDLMPEGKVRHIEDMQARGANVAFVGDGLNDAPVLAVSNVGVAMGGLGSDVAIEAADVILQTDQPSKLAEAIRVARRTQTVVWQNIVGAVGIKLLILALGALGMATLWAAVFADVGVALLAVLNAMRLLIGKKD